jgi:peroxiredoxin Q/BCP
VLRKFNLAYFTASVDSVEQNTDFAKSLDLDYPILSDPSKKVAEAFGCLNARGMSNRWTYYIGKDGKILYVDKSVKAAEHGKAIAEKLAELGVEKKEPS